MLSTLRYASGIRYGSVTGGIRPLKEGLGGLPPIFRAGSSHGPRHARLPYSKLPVAAAITSEITSLYSFCLKRSSVTPSLDRKWIGAVGKPLKPVPVLALPFLRPACPDGSGLDHHPFSSTKPAAVVGRDIYLPHLLFLNFPFPLRLRWTTPRRPAV